MKSEGRIRREVVLPWDARRVWQAVSKPERLGQWLAPVIKIELAPKGELYCAWPNESDEAEGRIVAVEQGARLEFSWRPFGAATRGRVPEDATTRVAFSLFEHVHGTLLVLEERGFEALPSDICNRALADNEFGWDEALFKLRRYLEQDEEDARETED